VQALGLVALGLVLLVGNTGYSQGGSSPVVAVNAKTDVHGKLVVTLPLSGIVQLVVERILSCIGGVQAPLANISLHIKVIGKEGSHLKTSQDIAKFQFFAVLGTGVITKLLGELTNWTTVSIGSGAFLTTVLSTAELCLFCQATPGEDELTWEEDPNAEPKDRTWPKLTWEDFQGEVPEDTKGLSAESTIKIVLCWSCEEGQFTYRVRAIFNRKESWALDNVKENPHAEENQRLLRHEKGHFNLEEVYARKLRKALSELKDPCKNPPEETKKKIEELAKQLNDEQGRYDNETEHGTNKDKQEEWEKKIQKDLDDLKDYK
jgi:hypothetical protein